MIPKRFSQAKGFRSNKGLIAGIFIKDEHPATFCCLKTGQAPHRKSLAGISLIEALGGLAIVSILLAIFLPSPQSISAPQDVVQAASDVSQALRTARSFAFFNQQNLSIGISNTDGTNRIQFGIPEHDQANALVLEDKDLPARIEVEGAHLHFTFNPQGGVDQQGQIMLRSSVNEEIFSIVTVETIKGYVRSCYSEELQKHSSGLSCEELLAGEISSENCTNLNCYLINNQRKLSRTEPK